MTKTFSFQQIAVPKVLSEEVREAISNNVLLLQAGAEK